MRLSGIARGSRTGETLLERTVVTSESSTLGKIETFEPFEIELEGGERVRVELAQHVRLEPTETRDVTWGDIEDDPSFASLRDKGPGPHVRVHVARALLQDGMRVEILAEDSDVEHVFSANASHRSAPDRKLVRVTARVVATGDDAAKVIDRMFEPPKPAPKPKEKKKKAPKSKLTPSTSILPYVIIGISVFFFVAASRIKLTPLTVDLCAIGITLVSSALVASALSRIPRFVSDGRVIGKLADVSPDRIVLFTIVIPLSFMGIALMEDREGPWQAANTSPESIYNASWTSLVILAGWSLAVAYIAFSRGKKEARLFRVLLGAPALPAEGELKRTWGSFEGVVRDPTPVTVEGEAVAIVHVISETVQGGSDPSIYTERILSKGTFLVDGDGQTLEIQPDGAVWTSSVAVKIRKPGNANRIEHVRAVPLRGHILVAGRVDRKPRSRRGHVASGGHESLLFAAVREGENVRASLHAMLFLRRVALAVALTTAALSVSAMFVIEPQLPKFNLRPSD